MSSVARFDKVGCFVSSLVIAIFISIPVSIYMDAVSERKELKQYEISLVRPDGVVDEVFVVDSWRHPVVMHRRHAGGAMCVEDPVGWHDWESDINDRVPVGWAIKVKSLGEPTK